MYVNLLFQRTGKEHYSATYRKQTNNTIFFYRHCFYSVSTTNHAYGVALIVRL